MINQKPTLTAADINLLKNTFATKKDLEKFATKKDLERFATKKDLEKLATTELVIDASETILKGVQRIFDDQDKKYKKSFSRIETKIDNLEIHLKDDIDGLKADLSTTISKGEFNRLKAKVDKYIPVS